MSPSILSRVWQRLSLLVLAAIILALLLLLAGSTGVRAQSGGDGCPDGPRCVYAGNFDSDTDGWKGDDASVDWLYGKALGSSLAIGILHLHDTLIDPNRSILLPPGAYKTFTLQPGFYKIYLRGGQDWAWPPTKNSQSVNVVGDPIYTENSQLHQDTFLGAFSAWYYVDFTTDIFEVTQPGTVRVQISAAAPAYYDYIWIEKQADDSPTPTPCGYCLTPTTGGPTATVTPTPLPTDQQSTPAPTGTIVCNAATPTPTGIPAYATPEPTVELAQLEQFHELLFSIVNPQSYWSRMGDVSIDLSNNHSGNGTGSAQISYDPHGDISTIGVFTNAIMLATGYSYPVWVNAWVTTDMVPVGETAYAEIWETTGGSWTRKSSTVISYGHWYPINAAIDTSVTHIAFVGRRTDAPVGAHLSLDDVYLYAPETAAPNCGGNYPSETTSIGGLPLNATYGGNSTVLWWPADRPCPAPQSVPNNFWGPILSAITIFIDQQFAWAPLHQSGYLTTLFQNTLMSPIGVLFTFCAILFDWSIPIWVLKVWMSWQFIYFLVLAWRIIRYSTVQ